MMYVWLVTEKNNEEKLDFCRSSHPEVFCKKGVLRPTCVLRLVFLRTGVLTGVLKNTFLKKAFLDLQVLCKKGVL